MKHSLGTTLSQYQLLTSRFGVFFRGGGGGGGGDQGGGGGMQHILFQIFFTRFLNPISLLSYTY